MFFDVVSDVFKERPMGYLLKKSALSHVITLLGCAFLLFLNYTNGFAVTLKMTGVEITNQNEQFRVTVGKIVNTNAEEDYSGTIALKLYASQQKYTGDNSKVVKLSEFIFTAIFNVTQNAIDNLNIPMQIIYPPEGIYYLTLALEAPDGYVQNYFNLTDCFSFDPKAREIQLVLSYTEQAESRNQFDLSGQTSYEEQNRQKTESPQSNVHTNNAIKNGLKRIIISHRGSQEPKITEQQTQNPPGKLKQIIIAQQDVRQTDVQQSNTQIISPNSTPEMKSTVISAISSQSSNKNNSDRPEINALKGNHRMDNNGRYMSPYRQEGTIAEWIDQCKNIKIGSATGQIAGSGIGSVASEYATTKAVEYATEKAAGNIPIVGGLLGGFLGKKVGQSVGSKVARQTTVDIDLVKRTSNISFDSIDDMAYSLFMNYSNLENYEEVIGYATYQYPELDPALSKFKKTE